jgi:hypothetical protein
MAEQKTLDSFLETIRQQMSVVEDLIKVESDIANAASSDDTAKLEVIVKGSEPVVMNFRGLERKRLQLTKELGYEGKTFSQILAVLDTENKARFSPVFEELSTAMTRLKDVEASAERIMTVRLNDVNDSIRTMSAPPKPLQDTRV